MTKLHISNLSSHDRLFSLDREMQQQVHGGFDQEIYNTLVKNKDYSTITYGQVAPNAFVFNIAIDRGENNQISQTLSA
jgi:hypothetical protein